MNPFALLLGFLIKLGGYLAAYRSGVNHAERKQEQQDAKAVEARLDVVERLHALSADDKRRMLSEWAKPVQPVQAPPANTDRPDKDF